MYDPSIGKITVVAESAKGTAHPPVISRESLKPGQGVLPAGLILMESSSGRVPWVKGSGEEANAIAGVLDVEVDTSMQDSGPVIIHGSVVTEMLKAGVDNPAEPDETILTALVQAGVYPE